MIYVVLQDERQQSQIKHKVDLLRGFILFSTIENVEQVQNYYINQFSRSFRENDNYKN